MELPPMIQTVQLGAVQIFRRLLFLILRILPIESKKRFCVPLFLHFAAHSVEMALKAAVSNKLRQEILIHDRHRAGEDIQLFVIECQQRFGQDDVPDPHGG